MPVNQKKSAMRQPLLGGQVSAKGPLSGERYFLPSPETVAADAASKMDERPDLFMVAGVCWDDLQVPAMANLCLIKGVYLQGMDVPDKLGPLQRLLLVLHDLRRKDDLVKLSLALDGLLAKLHNAKSIEELIVGHFPLIATDHQTVVGEPLRMEDTVTIEMLGILCFMHFSALQPGPNSSSFPFNDSIAVPITALTADPVHQFKNGDTITTCYGAQFKAATQSQSKPKVEGRMHAKWLCHDKLFPVMNMLIKYGDGRNKNSFEPWVRTVFADLLSNAGVIVKVRIANSISFQNKMLSLFTTAATTLLSWILHLWSSDSQQQ